MPLYPQSRAYARRAQRRAIGMPHPLPRQHEIMQAVHQRPPTRTPGDILAQQDAAGFHPRRGAGQDLHLRRERHMVEDVDQRDDRKGAGRQIASVPGGKTQHAGIGQRLPHPVGHRQRTRIAVDADTTAEAS